MSATARDLYPSLPRDRPAPEWRVLWASVAASAVAHAALIAAGPWPAPERAAEALPVISATLRMPEEDDAPAAAPVTAAAARPPAAPPPEPPAVRSPTPPARVAAKRASAPSPAVVRDADVPAPTSAPAAAVTSSAPRPPVAPTAATGDAPSAPAAAPPYAAAPPVATPRAPERAARYLSAPPPRYPLAARRDGIEGTVTIKVLVTAQGVPARVEIAQSSGSEVLDRAALEAVRGWRFAPAQRGAEPVDAWVLVPVEFHLRSG